MYLNQVIVLNSQGGTAGSNLCGVHMLPLFPSASFHITDVHVQLIANSKSKLDVPRLSPVDWDVLQSVHDPVQDKAG